MSRIVQFVIAGGAIIGALLAAIASATIAGEAPESLPAGPGTFDGVVDPDSPTVASPVGAPLVFGSVEIGARHRGQGASWLARPLHRDIRGVREVTLNTEDGPSLVRFTDPFTQLKDFDIESGQVPDLEGHPEAAHLPGWRNHEGPGGFYFSVLGIRPGEPLWVVTDAEGHVVEAWKGGLEAQDRRLRRREASSARMVMVLRGLALALALIGLPVGFVAVMRRGGP